MQIMDYVFSPDEIIFIIQNLLIQVGGKIYEMACESFKLLLLRFEKFKYQCLSRQLFIYLTLYPYF